MKRRAPFYAITLLFLTGGLLAAQASLQDFFARDVPTTWFLDRLVAQGVLPLDAYTVRQHDRDWILQQLERRSEALDRLSPADVARVKELQRYLRFQEATLRFSTQQPQGQTALRLGARIVYQGQRPPQRDAMQWSARANLIGKARHFGFSGEIGWGVVTSSSYRYAADEHPLMMRSFSFLPEQVNLVKGFLSLGTPLLSVQVGRMDVVWGSGRGASLLLSDNTDAKDGVRFSARWGPLRFESITATMPHPGFETYFSAHRLSATFGSNLVLSAYEGVVYADRLELSYLNPIGVYLLSVPIVERNTGTNANMLFGAEGLVRVGRGIILFGDVLIDDLQPQKGGSILKNWDSKYALHLGAHAFSPLGMRDYEVRAEYAWANQYTYTHELPELTYTLSKRPLGLWLGPDAEILWINVSKLVSTHVRVGVDFLRTRKGEQSIDDPHQPGDPETWEFLSGVEEVRSRIGLYGVLHSIGRRTITARLYREAVRNEKHEIGNRKTQFQLEVEITNTF